MKSGIDVIRFTLHQFLVGAASSREIKSLYSHNCIIAAGSRSHNQNHLKWQNTLFDVGRSTLDVRVFISFFFDLTGRFLAGGRAEP
jgi:hypothetical protein